MRVELIDSMGTDLAVVDAARVSFNKSAQWEVATETQWESHTLLGDLSYDVPVNKLSDKDAKLIRYLADHNHWSPFSHCYVKFRVTAPIFVARQLQKHTVGLAWNEVSRRYVDDAPEFYTPDVWRAKADHVKQGSSDKAVNIDDILNMEGPNGAIKLPSEIVADALETYETLIKMGICAEQSRMILPQSMMTTWIWSGSLYAFARVVKLRTDSHTQRETQEIANLIQTHLTELFPVSMDALI